MLLATAELALVALRRSTSIGRLTALTAITRTHASQRTLTEATTRQLQQQEPKQTQKQNRNQETYATPTSQFDSYEDEVIFRRAQARRSIFIKMKRPEHMHMMLENQPSAYDGCVHCVFLFGTNGSCYSIVEFKHVEQMASFLKTHCAHFEAIDDDIVPCTPRLLFYHPRNKPTNDRNSPSKAAQIAVRNFTQSYALGPFDLNNADDRKRLDDVFTTASPATSSTSTVLQSKCSQQIRHLYLWSRIDELGYRLRFLVASLIEDPFRGLFDRITCLPFGSSMNRYGDKSSDLDMSLSLGGEPSLDERLHTSDNHQVASEEASFRFMSKMSVGSQSAASKVSTVTSSSVFFSQNHAQLVDFYRFFGKLISNVYPMFTLDQVVTGARVPIAKFEFNIVPKLDCDLSITNNTSAYQMSKLLWVYNQLDDRVPPLMYLVK